MVILEGILDHEEREDKQQFQYLKTTQLAIMTFFDTDAGRTQMEMTDCSHNAIYRLVAIAFLWKNPLSSEIICLSLTIAFSKSSLKVVLKDTHFL